MQLQTLLAITLTATGALAAPAAASNAVSTSANTQWTIRSMKRTCNAGDTSCAVSFGIDTGAGVTPCSYTVTGSPASQAPKNGVQCGAFAVTSGWSGQFGPGNGFTTWSVVDYAAKKIAWPAYRDTQLVNGKVVNPDLSFNVQNL